MSWVSLSGSDACDYGKNSYKEVAKQAFASPTNLSSRLGNRTPAKPIDGLHLSGSESVSSRRAPSKISSHDESEAFHQMFNSTAVRVSKKHARAKESKSSNDLGEGLKALAKRASRQYHADLSSTDAEASGAISGSTGRESFSIGSVSRRTKDLDLAHNDNSFHVIGGLIVEFFHSKQRSGNSDLRLTAQDIAQLDRLAPPRVRASFVEAVRYRFTNAPTDSTTSVHKLARQCHDLGLDAEGPQNPLLVAAEAEIVIPVLRAYNRMAASSLASSGNQASDSDPFESVAPNVSTPSYPSSEDYRRTNKSQQQIKHDAAADSRSSGYSASASALAFAYDESMDPPLSPLLPTFGRPPRQSGEDPPASVSTRLTKLGVEVPYGSESGSEGNDSYVASGNESQASSAQRPDPSVGNGSVHGSMRESLTQFGIEMPRYDGAVSAGGEISVLTMKSMTTSLTKLGVEMPLQAASDYAQSESNVSRASEHKSQSSGQKSHTSSQKSQSAEQKSHTPAAIATPAPAAQNQPEQVASTPVLSSSKTDEESSILPAGSSKDFGNSEGLAKQQLMAELREASNLMSESKTQEAAKFWRDHVLELEARLRALNGEGASVASDAQKESQLLEQGKSRQGEGTSQAEQASAVGRNTQDEQVSAIVPEPTGSADNTGTNSQPMPSPANSYQGTSSQISAVHDHTGNIDLGSTRAPLMIDPSLEGVPMVDVVAPADLPGGYHFEAEIEGRRFLATVPAGGVQKGETFSCYMRDLEKVGSDVPVGRWRDGLFDCSSVGCCHPVICNALFCPLVILGQIMTRVGFDFLGRPSLDNSVNGPGTLWTILLFWVFVNLALFSVYNVKWSRGMELSVADLGALAFVNIAYMLFVVYLTSATRGSLREKYYIRESRFHDLEDCCCATFCLPCSVCQMARHTANYDEYEGVCCNDTGLPDSYGSNTAEPLESKRTNSYFV